MKVRITFKTPDALSDAAREAAANACEEAKKSGRHRLADYISDNVFDEVMDAGELFIKYGEIVVLELDTETKLCTVLKVS